MAVRIAINGLGRIGRCVLRAIVEYNRTDVELVAVNGPAPMDTHIHLLKYDSVHGIFNQVEKISEDELKLGNNNVKLYRERDPLNLPWGDLGVDVVLECTGKFKTAEDLEKHITSGAKKVVISAPADGAEIMVVYGVNNEALTAEHKFISVGSCTTNCLAPVVKVLNDNFGLEQGFMTTIHSYTNDQNIMDNSHKDLQRARAGAMSMIPTSTGAAKAIGKVLPELSGKLDGVAIRVPTPNVSLVDFKFNTEQQISASAINDAVKTASSGDLKNVLGYNDEPLVSVDYVHNPHSSIFDAGGTKVLGDNFGRVMSWYDNEWGFSVRMLDIVNMLENL